MPLPFSKHLDIKLIRLVKDNPILYNARTPNYLDFDSREVAWHKIGDTLNRPALKIAAIQCQIQYGDFQEDKHKPGLIENLNEYLPEQYSSYRSLEKKILKLFREHHGLSQLDAKLLYTKTARDLSTYGVTFFLVKEKQKGKKKLVPRLLGINAQSILRLDEFTKEILQVWPLTHVRSYHTGKTDTFNLNFGDYSENEYSCKTNEALRIKDILEGYIDITRKRMGRPYDGYHPDSAAICQDHVQASSANIITHVSNNASKIVEHSMIGSSSIIDCDEGSTVPQRTQIMTVQQVLVANKGMARQQAVSGEVRMRSDMSLEFTRKLNRLNSNSVKIVTLLTDPSKDNIKEAQKIVDSMEADMPSIIQGVKEASAKQTTPEAKQKLLNELDELCDLVNALSLASRKDNFNPEDVQEPARRIADLTTQIYFALDARTKRRSEFVTRTRQSFIADEKTDATLRRASFIAAAATACKTVDDAREAIDQKYTGKPLSSQELQELEAGAVDKMGKMNAAVALYLTAYSDPKNVDFIAALTSMNTINELMPELTKDAKILSTAQKSEMRQELLNDIRALCDATRNVCLLTGSEDREKMRLAANGFAETSGKLIYVFGTRNCKVNADKENEILDLVKDVGDMTALLLMKANTLTSAAEADPRANDLDTAGVSCADAVRDLLACAQLTAPSIHEPHCQSALTAAAENVSSSAQHLTATWKPLVEDGRHEHGEELQAATLEVAKALDRLKNSYANLGEEAVVDDSPEAVARVQRLRFITTISAAQGAMKAAAHELDKPEAGVQLNNQQTKQVEGDISQKMAQINAAVASLLNARSDKNNPDYATSELAIATISELMPEVIRDIKALRSSCKDDRMREMIMHDVRAWCDGVTGVCASAGHDDVKNLDAAAQNFAKASRKLSFVFSPRANKAREQLLMELSQSVHSEAMHLVDSTHTMADTLGGANGEKLRARGDNVGDCARALRMAAELTAPSIEEPHCRSVLLETTDTLASSARELVFHTARLQDDETGCRVLSAKLHQQRDDIQRKGAVLETTINKIKETCQDAESESKKIPPPLPVKRSSSEDVERYAVPKVPLATSERRVSQDFLDNLRKEESLHHHGIPPPVTFADQNKTSSSIINKAESAKKHAVLAKEAGAKNQEMLEKKQAAKAEKQALVAKEQSDKQFSLSKEEAEKLALLVKAEAEKQASIIKEEAKRQLLVAKKDEERLIFKKSVERADENIRKAELELKKVNGAKNIQVLNDDQTTALEDKLEWKLASASAAATALLGCNNMNGVDYATASQKTKMLSELMPKIVADAKSLSFARDEKSKRLLLDEVLSLCEATRRLFAAAKDDTDVLKVNEAAVAFGDESTRLMYLISADVDPAQEKEVIARARAIGDSASRLAMCVAMGADSARAQAICDAGKTCADAAGTFVYTAKLVAPSVQQPECQQALVDTSKQLSSNLTTFRSTWTPLSSDPKHSASVIELTAEAESLEKLLEEFRKDLEGGKLVKRKERIVVENTPLRQLACTVLDDAVKRSEATLLPKDKISVNEYSRKLGAAIKDLDAANHRVKRTPNDLNRRQELENAVQQLQYIVLQSRPTLGDKPLNNIVDLTDFVKEVSSEADKFMDAVNKTKVTSGKQGLENIKKECLKMNRNAFKLLSPSSQQNSDDSALDGILEVDNFGQDCDKLIRDIDAILNSLEEKHAKDSLQQKILPLAESNNLLRFATKSALAAAKSAALDETLEDLTDLENKIDQMLVPAQGRSSVHKIAPASLVTSRVRLAARAAGGTQLAPALTAYVTELRACTQLNDPEQRNKMKEHIEKLVELLKQLTSRTSTRAATWKPTHGTEVNEIMRQVLQELGNAEVGCGPGKPKARVLDDNDINRLLLPSDNVKIEGSKKELEQKLQQCGTKLNSLMGVVTMSAARPESLCRSAHAAVDEATRFTATARAMAPDDPVQKNRIEEACQEMNLATYNLLKTSELVCQEPDDPGLMRRLLDACRGLNDSINKLVRTSSPEKKLQAECQELTRSLQIQTLSQAAQPTNTLPYADSVETLQSQMDIIQKLQSDQPMSREDFSKSLSYVTSAVCNSTEYARQCCYLISISEQNQDVAKEGLVDVPRLQKLSSTIHDISFRILRAGQLEQAKEEELQLNSKIQELEQAIKKTSTKVKDANTKRELTESAFKMDVAAKGLNAACNDKNATMDKISTATMSLLDYIGVLNSVLERSALVPAVGDLSAEVKSMRDDVMMHSKKLVTQTQALIKEVKRKADDEQELMTWVTFNAHRTGVLKAFESLLTSLKTNGRRAGLVETAKVEIEEESEVPKKSYIQIQEEVAKKWLQRRPSKPEVQAAGVEAVRNIIDIAQQMSEDMKGQEKEEMQHLVTESQDLAKDCAAAYDNDKASILMDQLIELRKAIERGVVNRVVEHFIEAESQLADLEIFVDAERDEAKREFLLEKKIAELLSQLGRVRRTARFITDTGAGSKTEELRTCSDQTELLAPKLVKAAQERVNSPNDPTVVENYKHLLAQYTESLSKVRDLCDQAVDPMEFVQTAGETMHRMLEESSRQNDPQRCYYTSNAITRLANRVITVSMTSPHARDDPSVIAALKEAQQRLIAADTTGMRASRLLDWRDTSAEILRTTGEVESVLGGENIFKQQREPDKPIYNAALSLHAAVKGWSARDNEIVAVAKRMAVSMARLSDYMDSDKKKDLILTSKSIVMESHEVARFAKKLAHECTDLRIRMNLLQVCERIPTISGQLKMLTTVKGYSLGHDSQEDKEAMDTLVGNAQNLMLSVREVVKVAASASVKIASQRGGPKMRWVRRNYY